MKKFKFRTKPFSKKEKKNIQRLVQEAHSRAEEFGKVSEEVMKTSFNI
ncbi:MAG: hypothetical protein MRY57_00640 [Candidatus Pacebacteria bacterium]|nr:hypothetical protein [Candidatus Paceibacterota bacterium]